MVTSQKIGSESPKRYEFPPERYDVHSDTAPYTQLNIVELLIEA